MNFLWLGWSAQWLDSIPCLLVGGSVGQAGQSVLLVCRSIIPCAILLILHGNQSTIKSTISNSNPTLLWMQQKCPLSSTLRTQMQMHQSNDELCQTAKPIRQVLNPNVDDQFSNQLKSTPKVEAKRKCEQQLQDEPRCLQKSQCCERLILEKILQETWFFFGWGGVLDCLTRSLVCWSVGGRTGWSVSVVGPSVHHLLGHITHSARQSIHNK